MNLDTTSVVIIAVMACCLFALLFNYFVGWYLDFTRELKSLNNEINRCTGSEKAYYKKQKRRLILSILPFVKY